MTKAIHLPDIGSNNPVDVLEVLIKNGDQITAGQTVLTLESDKATIDVPAPEDGLVEQVLVKAGDKIKTGDAIFELKANAEAKPDAKPADLSAAKPEQTAAAESTKPAAKQTVTPPETTAVTAAESSPKTNDEIVFAGPAVRRLARELGVNLIEVTASGNRGRIMVEDVQQYVKKRLSQAPTSHGGLSLPTMPAIDFAQFGPIEAKPLGRIKKLTAQNLSRNWLLAPHVTQFDEADITELEAFRKKEATQFEKQGFKLTPLVFIMKAVVNALKTFPQFNASINHTGEQLIYKQYYHIGIAVDTPDGLVVPVIRDVDQKSLSTLAKELAEISSKAREKKLSAQDMQGSSFTISSLGGIGGTAFTPIINLPNVAILGVSKSSIKPQFDGQQFQPRLMLPLSLSYDHRVIDGAEGARFCALICQYLSDIRKILL